MSQQTFHVEEIMTEVRDILALSNDVIDRSQCALWWSNGVLDCLIGQYNAPDPMLDHASYQAYLDGIKVTLEARNKGSAIVTGAVRVPAPVRLTTPQFQNIDPTKHLEQSE